MERLSTKRTIIFHLFLVSLVLLGITPGPGGSNDASRLALTESLLTRSQTNTTGSPFFNLVDMVFVNGQFYSDKPPLLSLYTAVILFPFSHFLDWTAPWTYRLAVITSSSFILLALLFFFPRLSSSLRVSPPPFRWALYAIVFATPLLPFWLTYNDHVIEAGLALVVLFILVKYRRHPSGWQAALLGFVVGVIWLLHPLVGFVFISTTLLFLLFTAGDFGWSFLIALVAVLAAGLSLNYYLYGSFIPFYFQPELYLYGPGGRYDLPPSPWLSFPSQPGLTIDKIIDRFELLSLPSDLLSQTLSSYARYQESVTNPFLFSWERWVRYDFLTFNPLVIYCLVLLIISWFKFRQAIISWILGTIFSLYFLAIYLRSVPGQSFGNRHLIPIVPLIIVGSVPALDDRAKLTYFQGLFWLSLIMMLPGTIQPWHTPSPSFLLFNHALWLLSAATSLIFFISPGFRLAYTSFFSWLKSYLAFWLIFGIFLTAVEFKLYFSA